MKLLNLTALLVCVFSLPCSQVAVGQVVNVEDEARASRSQLAAEIAAIDGELLRTRLLSAANNKQLAHWYAGEVQIEGRWVNLLEAEELAQQDAKLAEYRELRQQADDRIADHERLARWCEKQNLPDIARVHWLHVLRFDSENRPALSELDLTWQDGMLLSPEEAKQQRQRERAWFKENKIWQAKIKRLRRDLEKGEEQETLAARQELREIREPAAVPALIEEFTEPAHDETATVARRTELLSVLGGIPSPNAVVALAEFAAFDPHESVRYAARDQLKSKPLGTFVPALLGGMEMPVEAAVSINNIGSRVVSSYSYSQEKAGGGEVTDSRKTYQYVSAPRYRSVPLYRQGAYHAPKTIAGRTKKVPIILGHGTGIVRREHQRYCVDGTPYTAVTVRREYGEDFLKEVQLPDYNIPGYFEKEFAGIGHVEDPAFAAEQYRAEQRSQQQALRAQSELAQLNQANQVRNGQIADVLVEVTGETLSAYPKSWWNWWSDYLDRHPAAASIGTRQELNLALLNQQSRGLARGTWVWTQRGKQAIETILPGDYVLAQDPRSGELAYKVVLATVLPGPLEVSKVMMSDTDLFCAPGHVLWATGSGWQRVSKLNAGLSLHGATVEARIAGVQPAFEIETHDLIVDGFHTYFIGEEGVLAHDATPIGPTHVALPGFSPAAVADAAQIAAD